MTTGIRYLIVNAMMGVVLGVMLGIVMLCMDTLGIRSLATASQDPVTTIAIFLIGTATTLTPFVVSTAVILCTRDDLT